MEFEEIKTVVHSWLDGQASCEEQTISWPVWSRNGRPPWGQPNKFAYLQNFRTNALNLRAHSRNFKILWWFLKLGSREISIFYPTSNATILLATFPTREVIRIAVTAIILKTFTGLRLCIVKIFESRPRPTLNTMIRRQGASKRLCRATSIHVSVEIALVVRRTSDRGATDVALDKVAESVAIGLTLDAFWFG